MNLHIFAKFSIIMANLIVTQGGGDTQVGFGWVGGWVSAQSSKCEPYQGWSSSAPILSPDRRVLCASSPAKKNMNIKIKRHVLIALAVVPSFDFSCCVILFL